MCSLYITMATRQLMCVGVNTALVYKESSRSAFLEHSSSGENMFIECVLLCSDSAATHF